MNWTEEQLEVIETKNKNILVSAAAGSGKTAVLTERILQIVTDKEHPVDIDKLVVVTFTKAAAAEMRDRILSALQKKAEEYMDTDPEWYAYLSRQLSFIHNARITTIDSFCMEVIKENFADIDIDPVFKIGEEGELRLLQADVLGQVLEECYEEGEEDFLNFVDIYSSNRSDVEIETLIMTMYRFAMSYPYPEDWILGCMENYETTGEDFEQAPWYQAFRSQVDIQLRLIAEDIQKCLSIIKGEGGPFAYESAILSDSVIVTAAIEAKTYEERRRILVNFKAKALSGKKQPEAEEEKKEMVKSIRDAYKTILKKLGENHYAKSTEEVLRDIILTRGNAQVLCNLTIRFLRAYAAAKREKNLVDFHDLEHFALEILVEKQEDGRVRPTKTALEMGKDIEEIMVDEYQDSNYIQELILSAISGKYQGKNNLFMVGDVKQSIYKFRMAKPELFLEKYNTFARTGDSPNRKIILSKNFRSRNCVLDMTNKVFSKVMTAEVGGIVYDEDNALHYGAGYVNEDPAAEILVAETSRNEMAEIENDVNAKELEAEMVAMRILQLQQEKFQVTDKKTGEFRDMKYSDVVILLRSVGSYGEVYERVFRSKGIPVKCPVKKGCFDSFEVKSILEFLSIIDNPRQDIPLVAVLLHIFHFTEEEVAQIKIYGKKASMYENLLEMLAENSEQEMSWEEIVIKEKLTEFFQLLKKYRKKKTFLTIYDLINLILKDTGFEYFVTAFPDGSSRMTNIEMLKERASIYQQGSFSGLFNFIRYIEKNEQYEITREVITNAGEENAVTIMSIHKSKGLEFPVVVVGAMGKRFNSDDIKKKVILHPTLGIGLEMYDTKRNIKSNTLMKSSMANMVTMENIAEELRVLYVAMTRAKEKLILAGNGSVEKKLVKYQRNRKYQEDGKPFHLNEITSVSSYLDWVLMTLSEKDCVINIRTAQDLALSLIKEQVVENAAMEDLLHWNKDRVVNDKWKEKIQRSFGFSYPYQDDITLNAKVSVSDVKHKFMKLFDEETELSEEVEAAPEETEIVPKFLNTEENESASTGSARGTAYHRVFELLDYERELSDVEKIRAFFQELVEMKRIQEQEIKTVSPGDILAFLHSDIGIRMRRAAKQGRLRREQQFVMGIPAKDVKADYKGEEIVLIQGIIDAYFEEDGKVCIVDYKTDNVPHIKDLQVRYQAQLDYYGYAVGKICNREEKDVEKIIYSVKHKREIILKNSER